MAAGDRDWGAIAGTAVAQLRIWLERVVRVYRMGFVLTMIGAFVLVTLGVMLNKTGFKEGNFVLAAMFLLLWAFFTFYPTGVAAVFGIGGLNGLPKDWSLNAFFREGRLPDLQLSEVIVQGFALVKKFASWSAHLAFFVTIVFVVLGTWKIENTTVVLPVFVILSGVGLWAALFGNGIKWYRRITIGILLVSLVGLLYGGYAYLHPQDETLDDIDRALLRNEDNRKNAEAENILRKAKDGVVLTDDEVKTLKRLKQEKETRKLTAAIDDWRYGKTTELQVNTLQPQKLCGVRPGARTFEIPRQVYVLVEGTNYELTSYIRVDGTLPKENLQVDGDGCVQVSFAFTSDFLGKPITPQIIPIKFK